MGDSMRRFSQNEICVKIPYGNLLLCDLISNCELKVMMVVELGRPLSSNNYLTVLPILCLCSLLCAKGKAPCETQIHVTRRAAKYVPRFPPQTPKEAMINHRSPTIRHHLGWRGRLLCRK